MRGDIIRSSCSVEGAITSGSAHIIGVLIGDGSHTLGSDVLFSSPPHAASGKQQSETNQGRIGAEAASTERRRQQ